MESGNSFVDIKYNSDEQRFDTEKVDKSALPEQVKEDLKEFLFSVSSNPRYKDLSASTYVKFFTILALAFAIYSIVFAIMIGVMYSKTNRQLQQYANGAHPQNSTETGNSTNSTASTNSTRLLLAINSNFNRRLLQDVPDPASTPETNPNSTPGTDPNSTTGTDPNSTTGTDSTSTPETGSASTPESNPTSTPETSPNPNPETSPNPNPETNPDSLPKPSGDGSSPNEPGVQPPMTPGDKTSEKDAPLGGDNPTSGESGSGAEGTPVAEDDEDDMPHASAPWVPLVICISMCGVSFLLTFIAEFKNRFSYSQLVEFECTHLQQIEQKLPSRWRILSIHNRKRLFSLVNCFNTYEFSFSVIAKEENWEEEKDVEKISIVHTSAGPQEAESESQEEDPPLSLSIVELNKHLSRSQQI